MKKYLMLLTLLLIPCVAHANGIAPLAAIFFDIPILILLIPIALFEGCYLYKKLKCFSFFKMFFLSFIANIITTVIGCVFTPIYMIIYLIIMVSINGGLESYGLEEMGLSLNLLIGWISILFPALLLFWISYKLEYKYIKHVLKKKNADVDMLKAKKAVFNANMITYILITVFLLILATWRMTALPVWKQTPNCPMERPLRGFTEFAPEAVVKKRGKCFDCNYADWIIYTTKAECDKCPNRHYVAKSCILNECPPEKPIRVGFHAADYHCIPCDKTVCSAVILLDKKEPCEKCPEYCSFDEKEICSQRK